MRQFGYQEKRKRLLTPEVVSNLTQLHRDLYKFEGFGAGGTYKASDNIIEEEDFVDYKFVKKEPMKSI